MRNSAIAKALRNLRLELTESQKRELSTYEKKLSDARSSADTGTMAEVLGDENYRKLSSAQETERARALLQKGFEKADGLDPLIVLSSIVIAAVGELTALRLRHANEDSLRLGALEAVDRLGKNLEHRAERHAKHLRNLDARIKK